MPTLSSILVQRGAATMRAVEDAIARQVFHGGDLATNLLEIGAVREDVLSPLLAECLELPAAPVGRLPAPSARVLRVVPGELALRHGIFPLELEDRALVVATAERLSSSVEDDLGFALDLAIRQVAAPLVRIRQAIAAHYGIPLERRYLRLVALLDGQADPSPSAMPPADRGLLPVKMPRPISIPSPTFGTGVAEPARISEEKPAAKTPFVAAHDIPSPEIPRSPALPSDAVAAYDLIHDGGSQRSAPMPPARAPSRAQAVDSARARPAGRNTPELPPPPAARKGDPEGTRALAGMVQKALRAERGTAPLDKTKREQKPAWRAPNRRKGPFTAAMAEREMEDAATSEAVLEVLFAFAAQFFGYSAIFVVHGDRAEARDAAGPGAERADLEGFSFPLDQPSGLSRARERRAPLVERPAADGLDAAILRALRREPRAVALLPVLVRARVVAILYGDDGDADMELSALGQVVAVIGLAGASLERLALRKKRGAAALRAPDGPQRTRIAEAPPAAEVRAAGVEALKRMVAGAEPELLVDITRARPEGRDAAVDITRARPEGRDAAVDITRERPEGRDAAVDITRARPEGRDVEEPPLPEVTEPMVEHEGREAEPPRATFAESEGPSSDDRGVALSPPDDEHMLPPSQGPRTARYFDEPAEEAPPPKKRSYRPTVRGLGAIAFPDGTPPPPEATKESVDSWLPVDGARARSTGRDAAMREAAAAEPAAERKPTPLPGRRGVAPIFEGRSASRAQPLGLEPLPLTPPPNATGWITPSSTPPPIAYAGERRLSERPIRREEEGNFSSDAIVQRVIDGGAGAKKALEEAVPHGEQIIGAVMARFPGPLRVDRHRARAELPPASQCGPILELCVAIRRPALPHVSVRLASPDPEIRFWATHVLGELRYPEAGTALLPRLFDDDPSVRRVARRSAAALVAAGAPGVPILRGLADLTRNLEEPTPNRLLAIETMGEIRAPELVDPLIGALEMPSDEIAEAARRALLLVTRQDFGRDVEAWRQWWAKNASRHRIEWLIDALMHEQPSLRRAAGDELKLLTKEYFGYYDDLPKRERERAQTLYRQWWEREGRVRFT